MELQTARPTVGDYLGDSERAIPFPSGQSTGSTSDQLPQLRGR